MEPKLASSFDNRNTIFWRKVRRLSLFLFLLTCASSCSIHTAQFARKNTDLYQAPPQAVALIRFDYTVSMPEDEFESGDVYLPEYYGSSGIDIIDDIYAIIGVYQAAVDVYERSKVIYRSHYIEDSGEYSTEVYPQDEFVAQVKHQYDRSYQAVKEKLERDLNIPIMPINAARARVPYDNMGYPLGDIEAASIPSGADAGLAIAIVVDYSSLSTTRTNSSGERSWRPTMTLLVDMIDRKGNILWSRKVEQKTVKYVQHFKQNRRTGEFYLVRTAGPDLQMELGNMVDSLSLSAFSSGLTRREP